MKFKKIPTAEYICEDLGVLHLRLHFLLVYCYFGNTILASKAGDPNPPPPPLLSERGLTTEGLCQI